ncbi:thioredoxin family protein [Streptomyces zhaozhouensis]|uniref:thioredoxin family protein n=1 Tax=Streptomyces zhaozhouensis TaxID=1300267 RepID=UPI0024819AC3|nr:thioredoxin domain-containing protein [Streptomyces zhaozhouensis]
MTDAAFAAEVLASEVPVLVDFTAAWCPPCRMLAPVLAAFAAEHPDTLRVVTLDIDHNPRTPATYGVLAAPTLLLFHGGQPIRSLVGARSKARLTEELSDLL